jgi:hypothetical protein
LQVLVLRQVCLLVVWEVEEALVAATAEEEVEGVARWIPSSFVLNCRSLEYAQSCPKSRVQQQRY